MCSVVEKVTEVVNVRGIDIKVKIMEWYVRKVRHNTFDVFEGKQYDELSWSRLKGGRFGVHVIKGRSLTPALTKKLAAAINPLEESQEITIS